jgi:PQQ-like domain
MIQPSLPSSCALPAAAARAVLATLASFAAVAGMALVAAPVAQAADWLQFNHDSRHSGANLEESSIHARNVGALAVRYQVALPGVADAPPVFLEGVTTPGGTRDLVFLATRRGVLLAVDAATGATVWSRRAARRPGTTSASPAVDPSRQFVYSYGLDGRVHKFAVGDGSEVTAGGWPEVATLKPDVEQGSSALSIATAAGGASYLYVASSGYPSCTSSASTT